jgi:hypothetical protein
MIHINRLRTLQLLIPISVMGLIGGLLVIVSHAATIALASEAESGNLTTQAVAIADGSASGGKSVRFGPGATTPTPPPPTPPPTNTTCTNPVFTTSDTNGGWDSGGYYVHNNMWNASTGETLFACAYNNWYVEATGYTGTSVKTYPNVHKDMPNAFSSGVPFNNYGTITSRFAGVGPKVGIYNVAYDLWLNGVGWGGGTTEVMIWTENFNQRPLGSIKSTYTEPISGASFDVWHYNDGDANVVSFAVKQTIAAGTFNLKDMVNFAIGKGYIPANPSVNQIGYGVEICSTNGTKQRFTFTDFSLTMN